MDWSFALVVLILSVLFSLGCLIWGFFFPTLFWKEKKIMFLCFLWMIYDLGGCFHHVLERRRLYPGSVWMISDSAVSVSSCDQLVVCGFVSITFYTTSFCLLSYSAWYVCRVWLFIKLNLLKDIILGWG